MKNPGTKKKLSSDLQFDVVVIGSGAAGLSAALTAAHKGLEVALFEKENVFGGTTAISGGAIWVPESLEAKRAGIKDSREQVMTYLRNLMGKYLSSEQIEAYLDAAPEAIDFLEQNTQAGFIPRKFSPDYHSDLKGSVKGGRTMDTAEFDGRRLGANFTDIRSPLKQFMALGGIMVTLKDIQSQRQATKSLSAIRHLAGLGVRFLIDRLSYPRGTRLVYGNALIASLYKSALDAGIDMWRSTPVMGLVKEGVRVCGVRVEHEGREHEVRARRGVVLATGGAPHNEKWRSENLVAPTAHLSMAPAASTGDGIDMGTIAGGRLGDKNAQAAFYAPVSKLELDSGEIRQFPHLMGDRQMPGSIAVNGDGRRFVNEASSYHSFVVGMLESHGKTPTVPAFLIVDARFLKKYGLGMARAGSSSHEGLIRAGYLIRAGSIADLARELEVPAGNLQETIVAANQYAETGEDLEFGKGSTLYNRYLGSPRHKPNPCLGPIAEAPFYAVKLWPGDLGTATGLVCDGKARVLGSDGLPVGGLYACGNDMNSVMSGFYPGGGITIGPGLTFGYLAAIDMASSQSDESQAKAAPVK